MKLVDHELDELLDKAGLRIAQPYSSKQSYRKDDYMLTVCKDCGVEAHYKLKYILDKNSIGERVCRACYWRQWYGSARDLYEEGVKQLIDSGMTREDLIKQGVFFPRHDVSWDETQSLCKQNGYELRDLIRGDRPGEEVLITYCPNCGRILPQRPSDVTFGCPCGGVKSKGGICYSKTANPVQREDSPCTGETCQTGESKSFLESSSNYLKTRSDSNRLYLIDTNPELAAEWYQAEDGDKYTPENVRSGSKRKVIWECVACGGRWSDTVREREKREKNRCPHCGKIMGSLAWKYPILAEEWHPDNPVSPWNTKPFGKLDFKPRWICRNNPLHIWEATTYSRINNDKDCPICEREAKAH